MAGIWDYVTVTGDEMQRRVNVSQLRIEIASAALGIVLEKDPKTAMDSAKAKLELAANIKLPADALADIDKISAKSKEGTVLDQVVYAMKLEYALTAAELRMIDETTFRSVLGI